MILIGEAAHAVCVPRAGRAVIVTTPFAWTAVREAHATTHLALALARRSSTEHCVTSVLMGTRETTVLKVCIHYELNFTAVRVSFGGH